MITSAKAHMHIKSSATQVGCGNYLCCSKSYIKFTLKLGSTFKHFLTGKQYKIPDTEVLARVCSHDEPSHFADEIPAKMD